MKGLYLKRIYNFTLAANDGWIGANLKPLRHRAYGQIVIKYAFC